jgi:hypothetical protein
MSLVYTIAELDVLFGYAPQAGGRSGGSWWANNWKRMVRDHRFPPPLPGFGRPRFSRELVDRWAANGGASTAPAKVELGFNLDALNAAR